MVRATSGQGGKGSDQRPRQVSREEYELRFDLWTGDITREEFDRRMKCIEQ